jgi:hypothetical protein
VIDHEQNTACLLGTFVQHSAILSIDRGLAQKGINPDRGFESWHHLIAGADFGFRQFQGVEKDL